MMRRPALALAAILVIGSLPLAPIRALAAPALALPQTVRVNVAGLGITYAVIASSGTLVATGSDGRTLYRGSKDAVVRRNVRRLVDSGLEVPPPRPGLDREERADRVALLREARLQAVDRPHAIVNIPVELSLLEAADEAAGTTLLSDPSVIGTRFTTDDGLLRLNGRSYRGAFTLALDDEGDLIVVNTVGVAEYLDSVVGSEMPSSWDPEALAAQAVAARTYLATHLGRHVAYDLEGDTRDQQYNGISNEDRRSIAAVARTSGLVATYAGAAIEALYSANAGGVTEDSENVFPFAHAYLRSVPSPTDAVALASDWGASGYLWTREVTVLQLRLLLARRSVDVGVPRKIEIVSASRTGRVLLTRLTGTAGSKDLVKDQSRSYFGLLSGLFTVTLHETDEIERVDVIDRERLSTLEALGAEELAPAIERTRDDDAHSPGLRVVAYRYRVPARFTFTGRGFGHGVGMSQWGAQGMALQGATFQEILRHYYTGIALTNAGGG